LTDLSQERVLWEAEFDPRVRTYWLLSGVFILAATVVGIPLIPVWYFIGLALTQRYLRRMRCTLSEKTLQVGKGIFNRVEKTVPLEKITDVGLAQGPVMRYLGLESLSVETAGQSSQGALLKLIGVVETRRFRDAVLKQRDKMMATSARETRPSPQVPSTAERPSDELLTEIRDTLHRIERQLARNDDA
jgi:putative membrane protein